MNYRNFGATSLKVSQIGFGCARIGGFLQDVSRDEAVKALKMAFDAGINFYDTADMYSQGESEELVGKAFHDRRDRVIIATKGGYAIPSRRKIASPLKSTIKKIVNTLGIRRGHLPAGLSGSLSQNFSPEYLENAVEASLRRLNTDYIDLYQLHSPNASVISGGGFVDTLDKLKSAGKIRFYGISCDSEDDALLALGYSGVSSLQIGVGLLDPGPLRRGIPEASARGVAVIARGCFGGGLLNPSLSLPELKKKTEKWPAIVELQRIAAEQDRSVLDLALQYLLADEAISVTLLGMRNTDQLSENLRYLAAAPLSADTLAQIAAAQIAALPLPAVPA